MLALFSASSSFASFLSIIIIVVPLLSLSLTLNPPTPSTILVELFFLLNFSPFFFRLSHCEFSIHLRPAHIFHPWRISHFSQSPTHTGWITVGNMAQQRTILWWWSTCPKKNSFNHPRTPPQSASHYFVPCSHTGSIFFGIKRKII